MLLITQSEICTIIGQGQNLWAGSCCHGHWSEQISNPLLHSQKIHRTHSTHCVLWQQSVSCRSRNWNTSKSSPSRKWKSYASLFGTNLLERPKDDSPAVEEPRACKTNNITCKNISGNCVKRVFKTHHPPRSRQYGRYWTEWSLQVSIIIKYFGLYLLVGAGKTSGVLPINR